MCGVVFSSSPGVRSCHDVTTATAGATLQSVTYKTPHRVCSGPICRVGVMCVLTAFCLNVASSYIYNLFVTKYLILIDLLPPIPCFLFPHHPPITWPFWGFKKYQEKKNGINKHITKDYQVMHNVSKTNNLFHWGKKGLSFCSHHQFMSQNSLISGAGGQFLYPETSTEETYIRN